MHIHNTILSRASDMIAAHMLAQLWRGLNDNNGSSNPRLGQCVFVRAAGLCWKVMSLLETTDHRLKCSQIASSNLRQHAGSTALSVLLRVNNIIKLNKAQSAANIQVCCGLTKFAMSTL